jgi:hypothetical protein
MATSARYLYAIRVEGIGDATANKLYRWMWFDRSEFDSAATADPNDLYKTGLLRWPKEIEFSVDFREGQTTQGQLTFELRRTADVLTHFWSGIPATVAKIDGVIANGAVSSFVLTQPSLTGTVFVGREAVKLGTESPAKTYAVTRSQLGTSSQKHDDAAQVFGTMHPTTLTGRLVELIRVPIGSTGYADEEVRWAGVLRSCVAEGADRTIISVDSVISMLSNTSIYQNPWTLTTGQRPLEQNLPSAGFGSHPRTDTDTSRALVIVDDETPIVLGYKTALAWVVTPTETFYQITQLTKIEALAGSPDTSWDSFSNPDAIGVSLREIFSSHPAQPSTVASPTTATLPLQSDPGKLILQLLLTTANDRAAGVNDATYDTGINQLAGSIPASLVDKASFERWGVDQEPMGAYYIGHEGDGPLPLLDLIQEILAVRGACLVQGQSGKLMVATLSDAAVLDTTNTISQSQVISVDISQDRHLEDVIENVTLQYNDRPGVGMDTIDATDVVNERLLHRGSSRQLTRVARGVTSRPLATILLQRFVSRFHAPIIEYGVECLHTADFWPGDVVSVTHDKLISKASVGVTSAVCLVTSRREVLDDSAHGIFYRLLNVGEIFDATGFIGPSARIASVALPSLVLAPNVYTSADDVVVNTDLKGFVLGDVCQLLDQYGTVKDGGITISSINYATNKISVTGLGVTAVAGDVLRVATYTSVTADQQDKWAYVSQADGTLDSDDAKEYTS